MKPHKFPYSRPGMDSALEFHDSTMFLVSHEKQTYNGNEMEFCSLETFEFSPDVDVFKLTILMLWSLGTLQDGF